MKGIIALDIDGTITSEPNTLPFEVSDFFQELANDGWLFIFITGRTFQLAYQVLNFLNFPFYMAVQNGALIIEMPSKKVISKCYLSKEIIPSMENICQDESSGFVIYSGFENDDVCYFRSQSFSPELRMLLQERCRGLKENWIDVANFDEIGISNFASVKSFGLHASAVRMVNKIESELQLHVPLMRDPFLKDYFVVQATYPSVTKGQALKNFLALQPVSSKVIAGGDDNNDKTMLEMADVKVVMSDAPQDMLEKADIIAPNAKEKGIIVGLVEAIHLLNTKNHSTVRP